jgi:hypothetical protein
VETYFDYLGVMAPELGERIVQTYPALQSPKDRPAAGLDTLLRTPLPAQALAITGLAKYLKTARSARIVAECGAGKTFMSLGTMHVHAGEKPYTSIVMCPPHIVHKWAREALLTIPNARAFLVEDLRNGGDPKNAHGIVEVKLEKGLTVIRGIKTTLPRLRSMGRKGWRMRCPQPAFFIMGREKGKLGYFWKHAFSVARSGPELGGLVNPDTGHAIVRADGGYLSRLDLQDAKFDETFKGGKDGKTRYSALWQADRSKIQRMAPLDFMGRYLKGWWDYAVADELHQLAGDTAQGGGLGVLARCAEKLIALTGTLMGGFADDLFNIFYRMEARQMVRAGFEAGSQGRKEFQEQYGVLETIEKVRETDNACSKAQKRTVQVLRKPGASPLLFGKFLMESTAFITLEDISDQLPAYEEKVLSIEMDKALANAYEAVEEGIKQAMKTHRGNKSLMSVMLNTLLLYPDHPYGIGPIWGKQYDPKEGRLIPFFVTEPDDLPESETYAKEQHLIEDIREELSQGRRCQVYATFTGKHDVTGRLQGVLEHAGFRVAVLRSTVATNSREAWYERQLRAGVEIVICHPKLVETGLDLLAFPTLYFYETGYSLHTLRQASRRSWRIGQKLPVRVKFLAYRGTMQEACIRHMGKKMLVALMMEGKFSGKGLQSLDADEDMFTALARELVEKGKVGESAEAVWRDLEREQSKHTAEQPPFVSTVSPSVSVKIAEDSSVIAVETSFPNAGGLQLVQPTIPRRKRKASPLWPTAHTVGEQLSLFG